MFVLDNSVAISWAFADEISEFSEAIVQRLRHDDAVVPGVWPLEVANALLTGRRRDRISEEDRLRYLRQLQMLPIRIDTDTLNQEGIARLFDLGNAYQLSAYDTSYLELAMRLDLPLATLDQRLADASIRAGVPLLTE